MKIKVKTIAWAYPPRREDVVPEVWDLDVLRADKQDPFKAAPANPFYVLLTMLGQGGLIELSVIGDSEETLDFMRTILNRSGGLYEVNAQEAEKLWLYQPDDECYLYANGEFREYYFLSPVPDPHL